VDHTSTGVARPQLSCERSATNLNLPDREPFFGMRRFPKDQAIPDDQLFAIALAALKLDHFQTTGDPCIRSGKKPNMIGANHGRKD